MPPCNKACVFEVDTLSLLMQVTKYQEMSAERTFSVQCGVEEVSWVCFIFLLPLFPLPLCLPHFSLPLPFGAI